MSYKIITNYITPNEWSRPQKKATIKFICVHWEAVVNARAESVRRFFDDRKYGETDYGSAHEIIDTNGDVWKVIPENEMAYSVGSNTYTDYKYEIMGNTYPNSVVYSMEVPTIDMDGNYSDIVYKTMVDRCADLLIENNLTLNELTSHGMIVGKDCPKLFHPRWHYVDMEKWSTFTNDVKERYEELTMPEKTPYEIEEEEARKFVMDNNISDGSSPDRNITRSENWVMLHRFYKNMIDTTL